MTNVLNGTNWNSDKLGNFGIDLLQTCSLKMGHTQSLSYIIFFFSIQLTANIQYKLCWWLDSNCGPPESEATEPQPLICCIHVFMHWPSANPPSEALRAFVQLRSNDLFMIRVFHSKHSRLKNPFWHDACIKWSAGLHCCVANSFQGFRSSSLTFPWI